MKRILILLALSGLAMASCSKGEVITNPTPIQYNARHYFYVQNELSEPVALNFKTAAIDNFMIDGDFAICHQDKVYTFPGEKTLVRVFRDGRALNFFYYAGYPQIYKEICNVLSADTGYPSVENIWKGKYWKYHQINEMEAEYTLILNDELMNSFDFQPEELPEE